MFSGSKGKGKRVVDMEKIWLDANTQINSLTTAVDAFKAKSVAVLPDTPRAEPTPQPEKKKKQVKFSSGFSNHGNHGSGVSKGQRKVRGNSNHRAGPCPKQAAELRQQYSARVRRHGTNTCPLSYHGFLVREMMRTRSTSPYNPVSTPSNPRVVTSGAPGNSDGISSVSVLNEIYQTR